jgi:hypothetical protein
MCKMDTEYFNDAFGAFSPLHGDTSFIGPLPIDEFQIGGTGNNSPEREPTLSLSPDIDSDGASDNDGLYDGVAAEDHALEQEDGSFGDDEHVVVGSEQHVWKINHAKGDHRLKGMLLSVLHKHCRKQLTK